MAGIEPIPLELVGPFPQSESHGPHFAAGGGSRLVGFAAGADAGAALSANVPRAPAASGEVSGLTMFATPDANLLSAVVPPAAANPVSAATALTGSNSVGGNDGANGPLVRHHHDPLWVLDANNGLVLTDNGTIHDFQGWNVDLYAQVEGATVAANGYTWEYTVHAPDVVQGLVTGQGTYHLHFVWQNTQPPAASDEIVLRTTNTDGSHQNQHFFFVLYPTTSPAWVPNSQRPTTIPNFPLLVPPDAVKPDQETISGQFYSLSQETGEVMTHFTFPSYHPAVDPLRLDYSSLAANPQPIFTEFYQLGSSVPNSLTANLYWNCTAGNCTSANLVASASYDTGGVQNAADTLNPGDIVDIALQYVPSSTLGTGRYPYQIDVIDGTTTKHTNSYVDIVNSAASPFGAGWSLDNLERIAYSDSTGAMLELPGGQSLWFASLGNGSYQQPPGDFSTLEKDPTDGFYTRTLKDGTTIYFYSDGREGEIQDPITNRNLDFNYTNPQNPQQLTSITDFQGQALTLSYNASGELVSVQDPASRTTQLGYDSTHNLLTSITEPNTGFMNDPTPVFTYGYDTSSKKLTSLTDPDTNQTVFSYSFAGRVSGVTRADQSTQALIPQQLNGLASSSNAPPTLAAQANVDYTDPRGKDWFTYLDWSGFGHGLEYNDPLGDETIDHRDTNGLAWLTEDPLDRATRTFFDSNANPTTIVLPDGNTKQIAFNTFSQVTSYTNAKRQTTTIRYPSSPATGPCNCPTSITQPKVDVQGMQENPVWTFSYDQSDGNLIWEYDPNGNLITLGYDNEYRLTSFTQLDDSGPSTPVVVTLQYNAASNLVWREDQLGHTTTFTVDHLGRTLVTQLPTGALITATFDAVGNETSLTDPLPLAGSQTDTTQFSYDPMNRVAWTRDPNGQVTTYQYAMGVLQDVIDPVQLPSGHYRERYFTYDDAGRLIQEQWLDGTTVDYTANYGYDAASELTSASDNYSAYSFAYDARGRVISVDNANNLNIPHVLLTYQYDANSNRTQVTDNLGGALSFGYDADDRLTEIAMNVAGATDHPVITLQFDLGARLTNVSRSTSPGGNQVNTALAYTSRNDVKSITHSSSTGNVTLAAYSYGYDAAERLRSYSDTESSLNYMLTYSYDLVNQLTGVTASNSAYNEGYSYTNGQNQDLNGNRSSATIGQGSTQNYGPPGPGNRLTFDGQYTYTYDNAGNTLSKYGIEGSSLVTYAYKWDFRNRLTEATKTRGGLVVADDRFTYDVLNRRVGKQIGLQVTWTAYDGENAYADFNGQTLATRYVFANGPDELVARTDANGNTTAWYLTDNKGSVRQIVDANGNQLYRVDYFSFGGIVPGSQSGSGGDRFKYAGREWNGEVGLYNDRARYYDPNTGRFISEDPLQFAGRDPNLYRYVFNAPTLYNDPSGLVVDSIRVGVVTNPGLASVVAEGLSGVPAGGGALALGSGAGALALGAGAGAATATVITVVYNGVLVTATALSVAELCRRLSVLASDVPSHPVPTPPPNPSDSPGPGWEWRGKGPVGGDNGAWYNPSTGETLHPDLNHPLPEGPHWDWRDPAGDFWRIFPDGTVLPR